MAVTEAPNLCAVVEGSQDNGQQSTNSRTSTSDQSLVEQEGSLLGEWLAAQQELVRDKMAKLIRRMTKSSDFINRLSTLAVLIIASIDTFIHVATSFVEGGYWHAILRAGVLVFINLPAIIILTILVQKAAVKRICRKVGPSEEANNVSDINTHEKETPGYTEDRWDDNLSVQQERAGSPGQDSKGTQTGDFLTLPRLPPLTTPPQLPRPDVISTTLDMPDRQQPGTILF